MLADQQAHIQPRTQPWASIEPHHKILLGLQRAPHNQNTFSGCTSPNHEPHPSGLASSPSTPIAFSRAWIKPEPVALFISSSDVIVLQGMVLPKFVQSVFETVYCWCTDHLLSQSVPDRCNPLSKKVSTHFLLRSSDEKLLRMPSTISTCCNNVFPQF